MNDNSDKERSHDDGNVMSQSVMSFNSGHQQSIHLNNHQLNDIKRLQFDDRRRCVRDESEHETQQPTISAVKQEVLHKQKHEVKFQFHPEKYLQRDHQSMCVRFSNGGTISTTLQNLSDVHSQEPQAHMQRKVEFQFGSGIEQRQCYLSIRFQLGPESTLRLGCDVDWNSVDNLQVTFNQDLRIIIESMLVEGDVKGQQPSTSPSVEQSCHTCSTSLSHKQFKCPSCGSESYHNLENCRKFEESSVDDRWTLVKKLKKCGSCFGNHHYYKCKLKKKCGKEGCNANHHILLHDSSRKNIDSNNAGNLQQDLISNKGIVVKLRETGSVNGEENVGNGA